MPKHIAPREEPQQAADERAARSARHAKPAAASSSAASNDARTPLPASTPRRQRTASDHRAQAAEFARDSKHAPGHARPISRWQIALRALGLIVLTFVLAGGATAGTLYAWLQSNISQHKIVVAHKKPRPAPVVPIDQKAGQPLNILLLGSDERTPEEEQAQHVSGMRSDTAMLMHISADRSRIDVISIPRDLLVEIPSCTLPDGSETRQHYDAMFNSAFMIGSANGDVGSAASCTLATVENMGNILIDGFAVVNFRTFHDVVNSLGGVQMCFKEDVSDRDSGLNVTAGCHNLDGDQALAIARARHNLGDGSDISRIGRQQELVFQIIKKLFDMNVLKDTPAFYQVASDVTRNLDTSEGLGDLRFLAGLAYSLRNLDVDNNVNLMMLPIYGDPNNHNRVRESASAADVWAALREDKPIPPEALNPLWEQSEVEVGNHLPTASPSAEAGTDTSGDAGTDGTSGDTGNGGDGQ